MESLYNFAQDGEDESSELAGATRKKKALFTSLVERVLKTIGDVWELSDEIADLLILIHSVVVFIDKPVPSPLMYVQTAFPEENTIQRKRTVFDSLWFDQTKKRREEKEEKRERR